MLGIWSPRAPDTIALADHLALPPILPSIVEIELYFRPSERFGATNPEWPAHSLGEQVRPHRPGVFPDLDGAQVALLGVLDDPGHARPRTCVHAPDAIREELFRLYHPADKVDIVDLGDLHPGATAQDTQHALAETIAELVRLNIVPLILGGGQGHTYTQYLAYEKLERTANLVCIDRASTWGPGAGPGRDQLPQPHRPAPAQLPVQLQQSRLPDLSGGPTRHRADGQVLLRRPPTGRVPRRLSDAEPVLRNGDTLSVDMTACAAAMLPAPPVLGRTASMARRLPVHALCRHQ